MAKIQYEFPQTMLSRWGDDPIEKYKTHFSESLSGIDLDYAVALIEVLTAERFILEFGTDLCLQSISIETVQGRENWAPRTNKLQASKVLGAEPSDEEMAFISESYRALVMAEFPKEISLLTLVEPSNR